MAIVETTSPAVVGWTNSNTTAHTTAAFSPPAGSLLVAMINEGSDPGGVASTMNVTDSTGGTWTLLKRQNTLTAGANCGTTEVWCRYLTTAPGSMTVSTISVTGTGPAGGALAVRVLLGAAAVQNGATAGVSRGTAAALSASLPAAPGNAVYGSGMNFQNTTAIVVLGNCTSISGTADATNNTYWATFRASAPTLGTATYGYTTSTIGHVAMAEIVADVPAPSYIGISTAVTGTTAVSPTYPTGVVANDLVLMTVVNRPDTVTPTTPASWSLVSTDLVGTGAQGVGTGQVRVSVFAREAASALSGTQAVTITGGTVAAASMVAYRRGSTSTWEYVLSVGSDITSGTGFSAQAAATLGLTAGDSLVAVAGISGNATASAQAITATSATFANTTERVDVGSATANTLAMQIVTSNVTSGTATAAPVLAETLSVASTGGASFIRLRTLAAGVVATVIPQTIQQVNRIARIRAAFY